MAALIEVELLCELEPQFLPRGAFGPVAMLYNQPHLPLAYEVEFLDGEGYTLAVVTVTAEQSRRRASDPLEGFFALPVPAPPS